jgi:hypothetical protein
MKTLLKLIVLIIALIIVLPIMLGLLALVGGVVIKLAILALVCGIILALVIGTGRFFCWLFGSGREKEHKYAALDEEDRHLYDRVHSGLDRMESRLEGLEGRLKKRMKRAGCDWDF